jgi:hypothetical protein
METNQTVRTDGRGEVLTSVRERRWELAPGQIVSLVAGVGLLAMGLVAIVRAGLEGELGSPVVEVLGFSHTALLGLIEVGVGLLLVAAGSSFRGRGASAVLGVCVAVAGVLVMSTTEDLPTELGLEESYGTMLVILGVVVAVAALVLPAWRGHHVEETVDREPVSRV